MGDAEKLDATEPDAPSAPTTPLWRRVLRPPAWLRWTLGVGSLALVAWVFVTGAWEGPLTYAAYPASALGSYYLVSVTVVPLVRLVRGWLLANPLAQRYVLDRTFNARMRLYRSTAANVVYSLAKLAMGVWLHSAWAAAVAIYYLVLTGIRLELVCAERQGPNEPAQWRAYTRCGWELLAVNLTLSGIVVLCVRGESFSYPGASIFAMAAFAFWRVSTVAMRLVAQREGVGPLLRAAAAVDASVAAVALFALQTAMFAAFAPGLDVRLPNVLLGTTVALVVTGVALTMVARGERHVRACSEDEDNGCRVTSDGMRSPYETGENGGDGHGEVAHSRG